MKQEQRRRVDGKRSEEDLARARAIVSGAIDERHRIEGRQPCQGGRGTKDFARGSMNGIRTVVMLFSRAMAVQRQRANMSSKRHHKERQNADGQQMS